MRVVNCFKMCIFALSRTTASSEIPASCLLWIASKCVSLHYHVQPYPCHTFRKLSCELLQNVYLCIITYNSKKSWYIIFAVVNCFKMCIFALSRTTYFLSYYFFLSCELLQNVYLCIITYNLNYTDSFPRWVVNCFKMCIFALSRTTFGG